MKTSWWILGFFGAASCAPHAQAPGGGPGPQGKANASASALAMEPSPLLMEPRRHAPDLPPAAPAFTPFGRVTRMEERRALWGAPGTQNRPVGLPQRYERWRERQRTDVGYGYLSIVDVSVDERFALVVSEDEAKIRTYAFPTLRPVSQVAVEGYEKFGRGDFVFWPFGEGQPSVVFAGERGLVLVDTGTARTAMLSDQPAYALRWTDDHRVLGATLSVIPAQRSRIAFYGVEDARALEPLVVLDFAERVEEWDLDFAKRRLAVTYYPSNTVEVLDLADRRALWVAPAPEYSNSVDISSDDQRLAVGGSKVVVFDMNGGRPVAEDAHFGNNIHRVRFSPSGDALAVSSYEGKVRLFDATKAGPTLPLRKLLRHTGTANVYALAFSRDGSRLVSSSGDKTVRVWGE